MCDLNLIYWHWQASLRSGSPVSPGAPARLSCSAGTRKLHSPSPALEAGGSPARWLHKATCMRAKVLRNQGRRLRGSQGTSGMPAATRISLWESTGCVLSRHGHVRRLHLGKGLCTWEERLGRGRLSPLLHFSSVSEPALPGPVTATREGIFRSSPPRFLSFLLLHGSLEKELVFYSPMHALNQRWMCSPTHLFT